MRSLETVFNQVLDRLVRPEVVLFGHARPAFRWCGYAGLACAVALALWLTAVRGLSPAVTLAMVAVAVATFFALAFATKLVTGSEELVYYHHEIAILLSLSGLLLLTDQAVLAYLDVAMLSIGAFLACGRIGCLMAGCCHGRPSAWGACYDERYRGTGFSSALIGVRLFPIQLIESGWVMMVVTIGTGLMLGGAPAGAALAWYVIAYDAGRYAFEFARGDTLRPYHFGFSEAQWIALLLTGAVVGAEASGLLPAAWWHAGVWLTMLAASALVALRRRADANGAHWLLHPDHVQQVAAATDPEPATAGASGGAPVVRRTSLGVQISAGYVDEPSGRTFHYALSRSDGTLSERAAQILARLIVQMRHPQGAPQIMRSSHGVYHVVIR